MSPLSNWAGGAGRPLGALLGLLLLDLLGARLLDALGLVESLLSPAGPRTAFVLPFALLFFCGRLALYVLGPGLLGFGLLALLRRAPPRGGASRAVGAPGAGTATARP